MDKHIDILKQLLIKQYKSNNYLLLTWDQADEGLRTYRIKFMIYDYLKD